MVPNSTKTIRRLTKYSKYEKYNILLNREKYEWKSPALHFLGYVLSRDGIAPDPEKVRTIVEFRAPATKEELRSFLELVTYVGKFIPDLADITHLLRSLLKQNVKFTWTQDQKIARLKTFVSGVPQLSYFNPTNRTRLVADASPVALGAVLIQ